jgi:hypothetical protein
MAKLDNPAAPRSNNCAVFFCCWATGQVAWRQGVADTLAIPYEYTVVVTNGDVS